jgi:hypothetical protein
MSGRTIAVAAGALLLVGSAALNAWFALRPPPPAPPPQVIEVPVSTPVPPSMPGLNAAPSASAPESESCRLELERCQEARWALVLKAMAAPSAQPAPAPPAATTAGATASAAASAAPSPASKTGPVQQSEALSLLAREGLRAYLRSTRDIAVPALAKDLHDPGKQQAFLRQDLDAMIKAASLGSSDSDQLGRDYAQSRATHITALQTALGKQPPDIETALAAVKGLYADEDAMMTRYGGDAAREKWRADSLLKRTAILASFASFGDRPWDGTIAW